ncbi:MAG: BTAD domain-containing putative transcriptional regulator [Ilumatobacter sp.]|uniref:nSTAND1 domain-containing NTPase n=1 Tax=Ilumatobacter sp. TaxID=1967498 RepID=UPI002609CAC8|nr:BTAD domain-containing putative transcriptional regulator [Ilumatobacter sp.]MDJ0767585.1 BTAD domain-containing putative transcriptional regulator [Ilumatobacter sp.]
MAQLSIRLFGPMQVDVAGEPAAFATDKARALLAYLAVEADVPHRREALAGLLWADQPERAARANLRRALADLRRAIGDTVAQPPFLLITRQTIGFNLGADAEVDARDVLDAMGGETTVERLESVASCYAGGFLDGFSIPDAEAFESWALARRERFARGVSSMLGRLADRYESTAEYDDALVHAWHRVEVDRWDEGAHRQLMRLLALNGQRGAALAQFEAVTRMLSDDLGVEPEPETRRLHERIRNGEQLVAAAIALPMSAEAAGREVGPCPYRGLAPFRESDAAFFCGRERFVDSLARTVGEQPVTVVVGSSGSGKTSAVFAGLLPRLRQDPEWSTLVLRPGSQPFHVLAGELVAMLEPDLDETARLIESRTLARAFRSGDVPVSDAVAQALARHRDASRLLLVIDQAEELYTLATEPEAAHPFVECLLEAVGSSTGPHCSLVATLRADFMGHALAQRRFADVLQDRVLMLGPMNRDELRAAIELPAERQGAAFEAGLVERLLDDVADEPGALPMLEFALTLLWEHRDGGMLTHDAYDAIGRVEGALAIYADEVFDRLAEQDQAQARFMLEQLVRPGDGTEDTRRVATLAELGEDNAKLVQHLADERLVVTGRDALGGETVEVVHEALIQRWGRLRRWLDEDRTFRSWQEGLRAARRAWDTSGHDEGALLRGAPLSQAETWVAERGRELSRDERDFVAASAAVRDGRLADVERRRRWTMLMLAGGLAIAIVLAVIALTARSTARREAEVNQSLVLASEAAAAVRNGEPDLAVALALEAIAIDDPPAEIERTLSMVAQAPGTQAVLTGHSDQVRAAAVSPDARLLLSGSCGELDPEGDCATGELILWDVEGAFEVRRLDGHTGWVNDVAFGPDGTTALSASGDGTLILWDIETGTSIRRFSGHDGGVNAVAFGPSGATALSGSDDSTLILWDVGTGERIHRLRGHAAGVTSVACVPGDHPGAMAVSAANDTTLILWDLDSGDPIRTFEGHVAAVEDVAVHPDGDMVLSVAFDLSLRAWSLETGLETERQEFGAPPKSVAITPDGRTAYVTVKTDLRELDLARWQERGRLSGHGGESDLVGDIHAIAVDPASQVAVTAASDRTVRVWNLAGHVAPRRFDTTGMAMEAIAVSDDGRHVYSGMGTGDVLVWDASDGRVADRLVGDGIPVSPACLAVEPSTADATRSRVLACAEDPTAASDATSLVLFDLETGRELHRFEGHVTYVRAVAFTPDGRAALSGSQSLRDFNQVGDLILWDVETGEEIRRFDIDHDVTNIDVSADGSLAVTGSASQWVAILWDMETGQEIRRFEGHVAPVLNVAFGPGDASLLTASYDGTLMRWDIETGAVLRRYEGHGDQVWGLDISPDGRSLISSAADGGVIVWDLMTGEELHRLTAHHSYVFDVAFGPDGQTVYSGGSDGELIEWQGVDTSLDELVEWLRANRYVRELTCDEREQYRLDMSSCSSVV